MTQIYWSDYVESPCSQNYSYFTSSDFQLTAYHSIALITIPLSIFTFFTIIRVTPRKMRNMKAPMLIALGWSTNLDLMMTVFLAPFMFFPSASAIPMGLLGVMGIPSKWASYIGQVSIMMIGVCFVTLLENRHSQIAWIKFKIKRRRTRIIYFCVNYIMAFLIMLPFYLDDTDQLDLRKFVFKRIPCPCIEFYDKNAYVLLKGGELLPFLSISGCLVIIVSQSLFFAIHTVYHLNYIKNAHVSDSTKALQRKFLNYVAMQITIPWIAVVCPVSYSLYADRNNYYNQAFNNASMLLMSTHGILSNSCTLFIITPYREFVKNLLKGNTDYSAKNMWATQAAKSQASAVLPSVSG